MEQPGPDAERRPEPEPDHHVADLADGGEGQEALQVVLREREEHAQDERDGAEPRDGEAPREGPAPHGVHAGHEVDARLHVAGGVEQRAHRGGGRHRVRDPGVERELHRLGERGDQHQEEDPGGERALHARVGPEGRSGAGVEQQHRREEAVAGEVRHGQHLAGAERRLRLLVPERDEQEGAEADELPAYVHQEQVRGVDEVDEPGDEEEDERVEAGGPLLVLHVAHGVEQDGGADPGRHEGEEEAQAIHVIGELDRAVPAAEGHLRHLAGEDSRPRRHDACQRAGPRGEGEPALRARRQDACEEDLEADAREQGQQRNEYDRRSSHCSLLRLLRWLEPSALSHPPPSGRRPPCLRGRAGSRFRSGARCSGR